MATSGRFARLDDDDLEHLLDNKDSKNTKTAIRASVNILMEYCDSENILFPDLEQMSPQDWCSHLRSFYAAARNKKGELYSKKTMISIRYGIQRHFLKIRDIDIVNNEVFKPANLVFQAMLVKIKQNGKGASAHKPPLQIEDITKIYNSFNLDVPADLQNKVFVDFMLFFCNRGRENLRELKKTDFSFHGSGDNKYISLKDHSTKNHRGDLNDEEESQGGRLYIVPNHPMCPVKSFVKYLSVLHPDCSHFWQRPKAVDKKTADLWFDNAPVGKNVLGDKMKTLSKNLNLSNMYTNHSLRATTITLLDQQGYEARHIMAVSGHKTESSIRSYSRTDESKKRNISKTISDNIIGNVSAEKVRCETVTRPVADTAVDANTTCINCHVDDNIANFGGNNQEHSLAKKPRCKTVTRPISDTSVAVNANLPRSVDNDILADNRGDVIGHETGNADIDLENMDFLELTSSQEKTLFQAVSKVSADDSFVQSQSCSVVERKKSTVLAEKRVPNNLYIQNVKELHIHYH